MQIEIIRNDQLIAGPMPYDAARVRDIVMRQGGDYRLVPNGLISAIHIGTISVLPVFYIKPEITVSQTYGSPERSATADAVTYTYPIVDRDPTEVLAERKQERAGEMDAARDKAFAEGMPYQFSDGDDVVQTRPQDQVNLMGLAAKAQRQLGAGDDTPLPFRALSNQTRMLTPAETDTMTLAVLAHIEGIYGRAWQAKDAIEAAETIEMVDATMLLQHQLDSVYADHSDTPGAEAARDAVRDTIPTLTDPESYDVEIAFRAHLRSQL